MLSNRFKPHLDHTILSFQYQKLHRKSNGTAQGWIGRLQTKVTECEYRDPNRLLPEQFICGLNDDDMTDEI